MKTNGWWIGIIIGVLIGAALIRYFRDEGSGDVKDSDKIKEYKSRIKQLEDNIQTQDSLYKEIKHERDSILSSIKNKMDDGKKGIKKKYSKDRSAIINLSDNESIDLLSRNIYNRRHS